MSQTAKILEMMQLGFSKEHIARHLGIEPSEVSRVHQQNTPPIKKKGSGRSIPGPKTKDRPAVKIQTAPPSSLLPLQARSLSVLEVKPGFYVLSAEDLLAFVTSLQPPPSPPPDPYEDYVQKEVFQEQYGVSNSSLLRYQKEGLLKVYRLGNKQYLKKSQVVKVLEEGKL